MHSLTHFLFILLFVLLDCYNAKFEKPNYLKLSLFSRVPPYLQFRSVFKNPIIQPAVSSELLWPSQPGLRQELHDKTIRASGLTLVSGRGLSDNVTLPILGWLIKPRKSSPNNSNVHFFQKVNSFPFMSSQVSYKDMMWINLKELNRKHPSLTTPFVIPSFILPDEMEPFKRAWKITENKLWISKLPKKSRSIGIKLLKHPSEFKSTQRNLVQKYLHNPILHEKRKVEFKYAFLVTSVHPLRIYSLPGSLSPYVTLSNFSAHADQIHNLCIHVLPTNQSQCGEENQYEKYYTLIECNNLLTAIHEKYRMDKLLHFMDEAVILTLISAEHKLSKAFYKKAKNRYNYFHLLVADFLVDVYGKVWLMEINSSPIRFLDSEWFKLINEDFYSESLNIAGYHFPLTLSPEAQKLIRNHHSMEDTESPRTLVFDERLYEMKLSADEIQKHSHFEKLTERSSYLALILANLTNDDIRMLMITEDELNRVNVGKRIFPTRSIGKYISLIESSSYYYKLLDAWESMYAEHRTSGRALLEKLSYSFL